MQQRRFQPCARVGELQSDRLSTQNVTPESVASDTSLQQVKSWQGRYGLEASSAVLARCSTERSATLGGSLERLAVVVIHLRGALAQSALGVASVVLKSGSPRGKSGHFASKVHRSGGQHRGAVAKRCILTRGELQQVANSQKYGVISFGSNSLAVTLEKRVGGSNGEVKTQFVADLHFHVQNHLAGVGAVANELKILDLRRKDFLVLGSN